MLSHPVTRQSLHPWCHTCPLRRKRAFHPKTEAEIAFTAEFKTDHRRAEALDLVTDRGFDFPLSQQQPADALGLSLVHTNKTWAKLRRAGLFTFGSGRLTLASPG